MADGKAVVLDQNGLAKESGTLTVFSYDSLSGLYTGSSEEYLVQGVGIPANSTSEPPPAVNNGKACVFQAGSWQQLDDHRGKTVYSTVDGSAQIVSSVGDYPANTTLLKPSSEYDVWNGTGWTTDEAAQQAALAKAAEEEKERLVSVANSKTQAWQTQLLLGIITEGDKAKLTTWMKYIQAVQAVDTSTATDIVWPVQPS
ncbi:TPA: tail fiber assembly protein [Enterobacter asburiae]|nr:tail fiber assembly protein [Enterobacter asburiae]